MKAGKAKYKETEIGPLPQDWDAVRIGDRYSLNNDSLSDKNPKYKEFYYLDLSSVKDGKIDFPKEKLKFDSAPSRARRILKPNNVIMATVRPNLKGFAIADFDAKGFICSTGFALINTSDKKDAHFLYHIINDHVISTQIENLVTGSSYPSINNSDVENLIIPFPRNKKERDKIAEILSSWDKSIELTENLIAKKEEQKRGLMQKLLTGEKRFKEFRKEKCLKTKLGECFRLTSGKAKPQVFSQGNIALSIPVYGGNGIMGYTDTKFSEGERILIGRVGEYCGNVIFVEGQYWITDNALYTVEFKRKISVRYLSYLLSHIDLSRFRSKGGQPLISQQPIYDIEISLPSFEEQTKIASVLSQADAEIEQLKTHLNSLREKKKGLMQVLLTGKKRVKI